MVKLGVNVDHVATLRQARGGAGPSPKQAALAAQRAGAAGITVHLREDRRHIQDSDVGEIRRAVRIPLNLEMAAVESIVRIALKIRPEKVCLVPERRQELTTEGGLDVCAKERALKKIVGRLKSKGIEVSLFIDPSEKQIRSAARIGADTVELHTGTYANARGARRKKELLRLRRAAECANRLGLILNAGHGLDFDNVAAVARIPGMNELNIGHSLVSDAVFSGLEQSVRRMKRLITRRKK